MYQRHVLTREAGAREGAVDFAQKAVEAGFSLQLGLLGLIAEAGGFEGISGAATRAEVIDRIVDYLLN